MNNTMIRTTDDDWEDMEEEEVLEEEIKVDTNLILSEDEDLEEVKDQDALVHIAKSPTNSPRIKSLIAPNQPEVGEESKW